MSSALFSPLELRSLTLNNRIAVSSMCQYSAENGSAADWHLMHLGQFSMGAAGLVMTEATAVSAVGRITPNCLGLYNDENEAALKRVIDFCRKYGVTPMGIQLAHAGRKGSCEHPWEGHDTPLPPDRAWQTLAPSPIPFLPDWPAPKEMDRADMEAVRDAFVRSAQLADEAGFGLPELGQYASALVFLSTDEAERSWQVTLPLCTGSASKPL